MKGIGWLGTIIAGVGLILILISWGIKLLIDWIGTKLHGK